MYLCIPYYLICDVHRSTSTNGPTSLKQSKKKHVNRRSYHGRYVPRVFWDLLTYLLCTDRVCTVNVGRNTDRETQRLGSRKSLLHNRKKVVTSLTPDLYVCSYGVSVCQFHLVIEGTYFVSHLSRFQTRFFTKPSASIPSYSLIPPTTKGKDEVQVVKSKTDVVSEDPRNNL